MDDAYKMSFDSIVRTLIYMKHFKCWPVTDMLHLFKNLRERVHDHFLRREWGAENIYGFAVSDELLRVIAI
jgi:hypothetical protein